jgi:hypothetical protein
MARRFVITTATLTQEDERELGSFLSEHGTWWHWVANTWLFQTEEKDINTREIRDKIRELNDKNDIMVLEINDIKNYSGSGPKGKAEQIEGWIRKYFWNIK